MSLVDCRPCACIVQADVAIAGEGRASRCLRTLRTSLLTHGTVTINLCVIREPECPVCPGSPHVFDRYV